MPDGWRGKILHIDLTSGSLEVERPPESFYRKYLGGSAMGMVYILREMPPGTHALAPEAVLTLMLGVTTGVPVSGQSRLNANARSPINGAIGDSQCGGYFPAELKFAGFDGIVIKGCSSEPVYLSILHGEPALHPAGHLMGRVTGEVEELIKSELGDTRLEVMQCGPAADNGVLYSSLVNMANRHNGRTGMGLVMASKNLKAIAVRGRERVPVADPQGLKALSKAGPGLMAGNPDVEDLGAYGTASVVLPQNMSGTLPTRNYSEGQFEGCELISGEVMYDTVLKERDTCYACIVRCKRVVEIKEGPYRVDPLYGGPEYETLATFGSYCGIDDLAAVSLANQVCNMYGVDTIACGATIAFAMECFEKGIIGVEQTGGLDLCFGNADAMLSVLDEIVHNRAPLGSLLSQGSQQAAAAWGEAAQACLITVKGTETPAHMPHAKRSLALIYAVNPFGADHQSSEHDPMYEEDAIPLYLERLALLGLNDPQPYASLGAEKVRYAAYTHIFYSILDTLELCQFVWGPAWTLYGPAEMVAFLRAVTGWDVDLQELMRVGERRLNLMRAFNAREGFDRRQDVLPNKFYRPLRGSRGPTAGVALDRAEVEAALDMYYQIMGWTSEGTPTREKLDELGLDWV